MSNITVTLVSGQTAVVGIASSREAYEVEVSSGMAGAPGVGIADATIDNGFLRLTLSNSAIINAGAVTIAGMTGTITFSGNTIGELSNGAVNIKGGDNVWSFNTSGGLEFPDATIQTTAYTGDANNALYLGGIVAGHYALANAVPSIAGLQTTAGLAANVAKLSANNAAYLGGFAANQYAYVNAIPSIAGLQTTAGLAANVATLSANNASYLGGIAANQYAYVNAIPSVAGFQTTDGLAANVATLDANNASYLGSIAADQYALANATISFNSITTGVPRLPANTATNVVGVLAGGGSRIGLTYLDTNTDRVKVWNSSNTAWLTLATTDDITTNTGDITFVSSTLTGGANADVVIQTQWDDPAASPAVNDVTSSWVFGKDQTLTFPDNTVQITAYTGTAAGLPGWTTTTGDHFVPNTDNLQDIGTPAARVRHIYVGPGSVTIGNSVITESTTGKLVLPGVTRATTLFANEVEDEGDQTYVFSSNPFLMDAYQFALSVGSVTTPPGYSPAEYDSNGIDSDGFITDISVYTPGTWNQTVADYNRNNNMYAFIGTNIQAPFNQNDWVQIPFSVRAKANDVEYEFSSGGGANNLDELNDVDISDLQDGQTLVWDDNDEVWKNQSLGTIGVDLSNYQDTANGIRLETTVDFTILTDGLTGIDTTENTLELFSNNVAIVWDGTDLRLPTNVDIKRDDGSGSYVSVLGGGGGNTFTIDQVNLHNGGNQNAQVLQFTNNQYQAVITGPTPGEGQNAQRLIIQGQNGGSGEGGDVYLWGGDADTDGGDIKIYAGDADNNDPEANTGTGGYVNIEAGRGYAHGGHVHIDSGYSYGGTGGDVRITAASGPAGNGSIQLLTSGGVKQWEFSYSGDLIIPVGGDIKRDGVSVLGESGYVLPTASANILGGVIIGSGIDVDSNGTISVTTANTVEFSDTAPDTDALWFNTVEARIYVKYNDQWVDANPTVLPPPEDNPTFESITFSDATVQTTAWPGTLSYNDLTDKPVTAAFVGGGGANTWLTAE